MLFLVLWSAVSFFGSVDRALSLESLAGFGLGFVTFWLFADAARLGDLSEAVLGPAAILAVACLYSLLYLRQEPLVVNFTNPDCFSVLLLGFFFAVLSAAQAGSKRLTLAVGMLSGVLALSLLMTGCRASLGGLAVGLVILGLAAVRDEKQQRVLWLALPGPLLGLTLLLAVERFGQAFGRLAYLLAEGDPAGVKSRLDVLLYGPVTSLDHPLLGAGPGTFHLVYQAHRPEVLLTEDFMNVAHNDYIQFLVDMGWPGLFAFLAFCFSLVWLGARSAREGSLRGLPLLAGWAAVMTYMGLNFAFPVAADAIWVMALAGLLFASSKSRRGVHLPRPLVPLFLLGLGLYLSWFGYHQVLVARSRAQAEQLAQSLQWEQAYAALEPALKSLPSPRLYLERARLAGRLAKFLESTEWREKQVQELARARQLSPLDVEVTAQLASALESKNEMSEAEQRWREALQLAPYNWVMRRQLVRNLLLQNRLQDAIDELKPLRGQRFASEYGALLALIEQRQPGQGLLLMEELFEGETFSRAALRDAGQGAIKAGEALQDPSVVQAFFETYRRHFPDDLCTAVRWATNAKDQAARLELLEQLASAEPVRSEDRACRRDALLMWANAADLTRAKLDRVIGYLETELRDHPSDVQIRLKLSQLYQRTDETSDARSVLREGLDSDPAGELHAQLGLLFASGGHADIAVGYLEE
ncbi:MAG: O-antigen ligase family protein, partial [Candidatus Eremiobacteraeota bacterium]|nr:O-antigen ligase family protein [Candidatus Eremiobacteraeota bacterium]